MITSIYPIISAAAAYDYDYGGAAAPLDYGGDGKKKPDVAKDMKVDKLKTRTETSRRKIRMRRKRLNKDDSWLKKILKIARYVYTC